MDNLDLTVYETAHKAQGGLSKLAQHMKLSAQILTNKVNYNNDQNKLSLREAVLMMEKTKNPSILEEIARNLNFKVVPKESISDKSLLSAIVNVSADHGKVHQTIEAAFSDKAISSREFLKITNEINDAIDALHVLLATIDKHKNKPMDES
ncbi:MAG: hypothetical protein ACI93R_000425 [Flavobacteriales bacterium]|jgi:hypothetical protein